MFLALSTLTALLSMKASAWTPAPSQLPSTAACRHSVVNNTITFFSHAPMSFSYGVPNIAACADRCAELVQCQAWLYSTSGQECHLYREQPLLHSPNPLFVSGFCAEEEAEAEAKEASATNKPASTQTGVFPSSAPTPSSTLPSSVSPQYAHHQSTNLRIDATTTPWGSQSYHVHRRHGHHNH